MKVALCGLAGVGKERSSREVSQKLGLQLHSAGGCFRQEAARRGLSAKELELLALKDASVDQQIDARIVQFANENPRCLIEGRRVRFLVPEAVSVLLTCEDGVRFGRIARRENIPLRQAEYLTVQREMATSERYRVLYGVSLEDVLDPTKFAHVIDTTYLAEDEVIGRLIASLQKALV